MAFVYEVIPEKDKKYLKSLGIKSWSGAQLHPFSKGEKWCIDRERNAFSIALGGGREDAPLVWSFWWNNQEFRIELYEKTTGDIKNGYQINWNITRIHFPIENFDKQFELLKLIEESFLIDTGYRNIEYVKSISVVIECSSKLEGDGN